MQPTERVAIVGMGALFARSPDPERFWELIAGAIDATTEPPAGRWLLEPAEAYDPRIAQPDKVYATRGGLVDAHQVDSEGLDLDPALLARLDPQFHLALHAARQAWRSARSEGLDRDRVGVILGNIVLPTETTSRLAREVLGRTFAERLGVAGDAPQPIEPLNAFAAGLPAGIVAKALGLGGGTFTLDAACASSLYALKLAADELLAGRADAMLAGGLSRPDPLYTQMGFSQLRALAAGGKPCPFDARGDGLIVGEGAGVFVLKRLSDALRDGDAILGVIAGAGLSNDVDGGLLAPSSEGQLRAMRDAYERAGWNPHDVDLIECHATGTPVGDAVEIASLNALWGDGGWSPGQCVIGSVKSNVGHALTAAGAAGLLKLLLAFRHRILPPTANFETTAPNIDLSASPFRVLTKAQPWNAPLGRPRRAAISGFGFGGINAHILIEEWDPTAVEHRSVAKRKPPAPIVIVGMAAHLGPFSSLRAVQERALGRDTHAELPESRHSWGVEASEWYRAEQPSAGFPCGCCLNEVTLPVDRFRIPPKELEEMLPQQSLMLRVAADAIADAGWDERPRLRAGTFIGIGLDLNTTNFHLRWWIRKRAQAWNRELGLGLTPERFQAWVDSLCEAVGPALSANRTMGALGGLIASRIAREFRIGGPSFTVSSEETSGTRALAVAARLLQQGELDEAVVGAVDLPGDPRTVLSTPRTDDSAEGPGEGALAFVLKRLDDAVRDGNRVYAVLRGFGDGAEGREQSLTEAGTGLCSIGYLDGPTDASLWAVPPPAEIGTCALASAQADFGRVGAASSLVALAKAVLCLHQQFLPPQNPGRTGERNRPPLFAPRAPQFWLRDRDEGPRRALVESRSLDGNAHHVVLEEHETSASCDATERLQPLGARPAALFAVEADDRNALVQRVKELEALASEHTGEAIERLARRWWARYPNDPSRHFAIALVAESLGSLRSLVATARSILVEDRPAPPTGAVRGLALSPSLLPTGQAREPLGRGGRLAFVYPGLGNLYPGMGRTLSAHWPEILRRQDAENGTLRAQFAPGAFWNNDPPASFPDHRAPILGQVSVGALVTDLLRSFGIAPDAAIGYSLGESSALIAMRAWTERDEMLRRLHTSPLFHTELAGPCDAARRVWGLPEGQRTEWLAGVVPCSPQAVSAALEGRKRAYRLIVNTPDECVIGGERAAVLRLVEDLGCRLFPLPLVSTVHCEITRVVATAYRDLHVLQTTPPPGVRFYSGAWGHAFVPDATTAANSILAHATEGIDFPRVIERAYADGIRVFVEVGPGASCTRLIDVILGDRPHVARSACLAGQDEVVTVLDLLARLIAERVRVDLSSLYGRESLVVAHREPAESAPRRTLTVQTGGCPFAIPPLPSSEPAPRKDTDRNGPPPPADKPQPSPGVAVPAIKTALPAPELDPAGLQHGLLAGASARSEAHEAYLGLSTRLAQSMVNQLTFQMALVEALMTDGPPTDWPDRMPRLTGPPPALDRDQCLEFAIGSIAAVLGPEFAPVDSYPTRVRLPDEPLMLVDRIMTIEGEPCSMTHGRVVTEHDILPDAWYLDAGRIPPCIAIESGQADLFLSGYLGIDFITRGLAVYRLLDASVTFHRGLPGPGSAIRYDIYIDRFFRQGDTHLFRFRFEAEVDGEPLLSMRDGCAGFFSAEELAAGKGIVSGSLDARPQRGTLPADWTPLVAMEVESYSEEQVDAIRRGDLAAAFGRQFENLPLRSPAPLPGGRMTLVDRVLTVDPTGGRYGLGLIRAEADIQPGAWFMVCHFVDDRVMPGTLMYECCLHTLRIYLTRLGWVGEEGEVAWEPMPGVTTRLRCRGQVIESTQKVVYEIAIKELGYGPEPYAIVDTLMYADGRAIVEFANMSLRLSGQTREGLERIWFRSEGHEAPPALYTRDQILAFATGRPSEAFGAPYRIFDEGRFIARLPAPPYSFLDRVTSVTGEPFQMTAGGTVVTDYDVPPDAWYFAADRQPRMPFAVLLEVALQPCGWMAAYVGSALTSDEPLHFRNLGGQAVVFAPVTPQSGTLTTTVKVTKVAKSAGMIIQNFDFEVRDRNGPVYRGDTYFGFFRAEALADQVGVREAVPYRPSPEELGRAQVFAFPDRAPYPRAELRMVEQVDALILDGGPAGLGFIEGSKQVNPEDWFFKAHFYQDPVCPGSLGLESFLQLLKVIADARWGLGPDAVFESPGEDDTHRWVYRGQVIPSCERVAVQAVVTAVNDNRHVLRANGFLSVDGRVIYQMIDFTLGLSAESR